MINEIIYYQTPIGCFEIIGSPAGISTINILNTSVPNSTDLSPMMQACVDQLEAYFKGELTDFDLKLSFEQGTDFQKSVWLELLKIPYGKTISYSDVAQRLGKSRGASQAIGKAVGSNPIGVIVPCHRVVGKDGSLTGFASGLDNKRFLLKLEKAAVVSQGTLF